MDARLSRAGSFFVLSILHERAISHSLAQSATLAFITDVDTAGRDIGKLTISQAHKKKVGCSKDGTYVPLCFLVR